MPNRRTILASGPGLTREHIDLLDVHNIHVEPVPEDLGQAWRRLLGKIDGYLLGGDEKLDREAIEAATSLQAISFVGTGAHAFVDMVAAESRGIAVLNTPGLMTNAVAEHAIGLLLSCTRNLAAHNESVKRIRDVVPPSSELRTMRVGIVGLGAIGTRVAAIIRQSFGADVSYYSRTRKLNVEQQLNLSFLPLADLFSDCEVVVLTATMSDETRNLISDALLAHAGGICLVNVSGAEMVDPAALRKAIISGSVRMAAVDGYWQEPPPPVELDPHGLLSLPDSRFFVTPHVAAKTTTAWPSMMAQSVDNLVRFPWR